MLALRKTPPSSASLRGRLSSGIGRGKSIGLTEDLPAEAVDSNRSRPKGPFKCYVTQMGVGGCPIFRKKALRRCKFQCYLRYEGVGV